MFSLFCFRFTLYDNFGVKFKLREITEVKFCPVFSQIWDWLFSPLFLRYLLPLIMWLDLLWLRNFLSFPDICQLQSAVLLCMTNAVKTCFASHKCMLCSWLSCGSVWQFLSSLTSLEGEKNQQIVCVYHSCCCSGSILIVTYFCICGNLL